MYNSNPEILTSEYILKKIRSIDIFSKYIGKQVLIGKAYSAPYRKDNKPSLEVKVNRRGNLHFTDYGTGEHGNCFDLVMKIYNVDYHKALSIIYRDFNLFNNNLIVPKKENNYQDYKLDKKIIEVKIQDFNNTDINYWNSYGITKQILNKFRVFSLNKVWLDGRLIKTYSINNPVYGYWYIEGYWKILAPFDKYKWCTNAPKYIYSGYDELPWLGELCIITSSLKDVMTLYRLGYNAIAPQSEVNNIEDNIYKQISHRFNKLLLFYDNDKQGISSSANINKKYNIETIFIPNIYNQKDISDFYKFNGEVKSIELIKQLINNKKQ